MLSVLVHRVRQTILATFYRRAPTIDSGLFASGHVLRLFTTLAAHDQRHLLAVHRKATSHGLDRETAIAALLHDIGKSSLAGTHVSVVARIIKVIAGKQRGTSHEWSDNPVITAHSLTFCHGEIGAERLRALGVEETVSRMVELHDHAGVRDERVIAIQQLDNTTP